MVRTSNDGIMTEYLISYGALKSGPYPSRARLLETLYIADVYRAGGDLAAARLSYDSARSEGVSATELDRKLADLDNFMRALARDRLQTWGVAAAVS